MFQMLSPFFFPLLLAFLLLPTHLLARSNGGDQQFLTSVNKEGAAEEPREDYEVGIHCIVQDLSFRKNDKNKMFVKILIFIEIEFSQLF